MAKQSTQTIKRYLASHRQRVAPAERDEIFGLDPTLDVIDGVIERLIGGVGLADRGLIFSGPPGTGKTLSARYLATRLGHLTAREIPFYVLPLDGLTPELVRAVFAYLDAQPGPSIVYLDEIDGFARKIESSNAHAEQPADRALRLAFLSALDGTLDGQHRALLIASTNLSQSEIHPALLRSGRLGRFISYQCPDRAAITKLLSHHLDGKSDLSATEIELIAGSISNRFSGADIRSICEDAVARASLHKRRVVFDDIRVVLWSRSYRSAHLSPEKEFAATHETIVHELGHAVAISITSGPETMEVISFLSAESAKTIGPNPTTEEQMLHTAIWFRAGRIAEELILGSNSLGSVPDFANYHRAFYRLIENGRWPYLAAIFDFGMAKIHPRGAVAVADGLNGPFVEEVAELWRDFDRWVDQAARAIIIPHRGLIEAISAELGGKLGIATEEWLSLLAKHGPLQSVELPPLPASLAIGAPGAVPLG